MPIYMSEDRMIFVTDGSYTELPDGPYFGREELEQIFRELVAADPADHIVIDSVSASFTDEVVITDKQVHEAIRVVLRHRMVPHRNRAPRTVSAIVRAALARRAA